MAKIQEEVIVITISKLVKNDEAGTSIVNEEIISALGTVVEELVGNGVVVEVSKA